MCKRRPLYFTFHVYFSFLQREISATLFCMIGNGCDLKKIKSQHFGDFFLILGTTRQKFDFDRKYLRYGTSYRQWAVGKRCQKSAPHIALFFTQPAYIFDWLSFISYQYYKICYLFLRYNEITMLQVYVPTMYPARSVCCCFNRLFYLCSHKKTQHEIRSSKQTLR